MKKDQRVSIQEVSRLSGVSMATVSRVIHQKSGHFSEETGQRVRAVMRRLNYTPDAVAQGMRMQYMPIVGIIVPDIMDENYALMVRTIQSELFAKGYTTIIFNSNESSSLSQHCINTLKMQHASGLIYVPDSDGKGIDAEGLPIVYFDRRPKDAVPANSVIVELDNETGAKNAVTRLIETGCRRIALLSDRFGISTHQARMAGYYTALKEHGLDPGPELLVDPQRTSEAITALENALGDPVPFDGIFCTSVRLTIGALAVLKRLGIPQQKVRVLGFGEHRLHRYGLLPYMAVHEPISEMAVVAVNQLVQLFLGEVPSQSIVIIPVGDVSAP